MFMQGRYFIEHTVHFQRSSIVGCAIDSALVVEFEAGVVAAAAGKLNGTLLIGGENEVGVEFTSTHYFVIFRVASVV